MTLPENNDTPQHVKHLKAYQAWKKKNSLARIMLLSNIYDDIMREFRQYSDAKDMCSALKEKFCHTSAAQLRVLTIMFDTYKKCPDHTICKHLHHMTNTINKLKDIGHLLTEEKQL